MIILHIIQRSGLSYIELQNNTEVCQAYKRHRSHFFFLNLGKDWYVKDAAIVIKSFIVTVRIR